MSSRRLLIYGKVDEDGPRLRDPLALSPVVRALKTSDTARTSTVTQAADPDLALALAVKRYEITGRLFTFGDPLAGITISFVFSGTATYRIGLTGNTGASTAAVPVTYGPTAYDGGTVYNFGCWGTADPNGTSIGIDGVIDVTAAGNLTLWWSQRVTNATATTLLARSRMQALPIS